MWGTVLGEERSSAGKTQLISAAWVSVVILGQLYTPPGNPRTTCFAKCCFPQIVTILTRHLIQNCHSPILRFELGVQVTLLADHYTFVLPFASFKVSFYNHPLFLPRAKLQGWPIKWGMVKHCGCQKQRRYWGVLVVP